MTHAPADPATAGRDEAIGLDVWADIACPWCFLGHRTLWGLLGSADAGGVHRRHRAFLLRPDMPARGFPYDELMEEIFGSRDAARPSEDRLKALGSAVGIEFNFGAMPVAANSRMAHQAVLASPPDTQTDVLDAFYSAYWELGLDITDPIEVERIALSALEPNAGFAAGVAGASAILDRDLAEAQLLEIRAVPTLIADGRVAVQGAQPVEVLQQLLDQARR